MDVVFGFGQVGQELARELTGRGRGVRVVSRSGRGPRIAGVDHVAGDATSPAFCRAVCTGAEVVYLCLNAPYDRWAEEFPPLQAAVLAGAESASSKLVVLENLYMYGPHEGPLTESLPMAAAEAKGVTRAKMSADLLAAHSRGKVRVAIGRASDFFGPGATASQLGNRAFGPLVAGKAVQMIGDPDALHSFAYIPDVARALATLGESPEADGRVWHLPSVELCSTREMLRRAGRLAGVDAEVSSLPSVLLSLLARVNPMVREVLAVGYQFDRPFVLDSSSFERTFGMNATPLETALAATVEWYQKRSQEPQPGKGVAVAKGVAVFTLDNMLIGLAMLAIADLVLRMPVLAPFQLGIAAAAGLYWLPPLRRASINLARLSVSRTQRSSVRPALQACVTRAA